MPVICQFGSFSTISFSNYSIMKCRIIGLLLGNPRCHGNHFVPHSLGVVIFSKYEVDGVMVHFT